MECVCVTRMIGLSQVTHLNFDFFWSRGDTPVHAAVQGVVPHVDVPPQANHPHFLLLLEPTKTSIPVEVALPINKEIWENRVSSISPMQQAPSVSGDSEPCATTEQRHSQPSDDVAADYSHDGTSQLYNDFHQQYIMLDGGVFVRVNETSALAQATQQQSPSSPDRTSNSAFSKNSDSDFTQAILPQLLIVPQHNMAVNSVSCAFSVGGRSFLVSPTCVASESSLLSILDGNVDLSNDCDGAIMLWCSWFATIFSQITHSLCLTFIGSPIRRRCMRCAPQIKDAPSSVGFGRVARRCSACRQATVQVSFPIHCSQNRLSSCCD